MFNIKNQFSIFGQYKDLIFFDNASTTQKPQQVLDSLLAFYAQHNANVHRGVYPLAEQATELYEHARKVVAEFIGAKAHEIVFTKGTTEGINFVAQAWASQKLQAGDEIILSELEHHANLLPWQRLAQEKGVILKFIPITSDGSLDYQVLDTLCTSKTKLIAITHISHVLGTHIDVTLIARYARTVGAKILIDAAQSVPHRLVDLKNLDCDFLVFSGHKMLAPTGVGVLYISEKIMNEVIPYQVGGGIVADATLTHATFVHPPYKFEAGTPPIAQAIGLAAAMHYIKSFDVSSIKTLNSSLCTQLIEQLLLLPKIKILGPIEELKKQGHLVSFIVKGYHAHDVASYLGSHGVCVRAGHHCARPLATKLGVDASVRASFYLYNYAEDIEKMIDLLATL